MKKIFLVLMALCTLMLFVPSCGEPNNPPSVDEEPTDTIPENPGDTIPEEPGNDNFLSFEFNGVTFKMMLVEGGTFTMGALPDDEDAEDNAKTAHAVTLSDYYMGETEVTQELWNAVMGSNPSNYAGDNLPVEQVSWEDCQTFIERLNNMLMEKIFDGEIPETDLQFRLPTEAEWEFAAQGGKHTHYYVYSGSSDVDEVAWYKSDTNAPESTQPVAQKKANELGLYDMSGNVFEWCSDYYDYDYYSVSPSNNPQGPTDGSHRVYRGGSWNGNEWFCRFSTRYKDVPNSKYKDLGLRLVLSE